MDYCHRARKAGAEVYLVRDSMFVHPRPRDFVLHLAGYRIFCRRMALQRRYSDTRNRIWIARRHQRRYLYTALLPSLLFRSAATLLAEKNPWAQFKARLRVIRDGLPIGPCFCAILPIMKRTDAMLLSDTGPGRRS